jgi:hypothetical protein
LGLVIPIVMTSYSEIVFFIIPHRLYSKVWLDSNPKLVGVSGQRPNLGPLCNTEQEDAITWVMQEIKYIGGKTL